MWDPEIYRKALLFSSSFHRGQKIKGTDIPYLTHIILVTMEVTNVFQYNKGFDENLAISCALLHDTIEDTKATYDDVLNEFGKYIADGVLALTKNFNLPKNEQIKDSIERILAQPKEIWIIKIADRIANLSSPPKSWSKSKIQTYLEDAVIIYEKLKNSEKNIADRLKTKIDQYKIYL